MDGILPLWKERGMTSHDCVFKLRKILQTKKIGHGGTLDPDVDGVLPICIGKGTRVIEYLQASHKTYNGEITLGFSTTTEDVSGERVATSVITEMIDVAFIDKAMAEMTGLIKQTPPMYSAVRVNGKHLYEYAREGLPVERPVRQALIQSFDRTSEPVFNQQEGTLTWAFTVVCGPGTYVRTLAVDTGKKLGFEAHMSDLTRTASGSFNAEECLTLDQVAAFTAQEDLSFLKPIEQAVTMFERYDLSDAEHQIVRNGGFLTISELGLADEDEIIALFHQGLLISLYAKHPNKPIFLKPVKVLRID